jgi:hypothetical protein
MSVFEDLQWQASKPHQGSFPPRLRGAGWSSGYQRLGSPLWGLQQTGGLGGLVPAEEPAVGAAVPVTIFRASLDIGGRIGQQEVAGRPHGDIKACPVGRFGDVLNQHIVVASDAKPNERPAHCRPQHHGS